jgi:hypothetical protein
MPRLLTRGNGVNIGYKVAGFISEWWPASNRNGGRHHLGIGGRLESESADTRKAGEKLRRPQRSPLDLNEHTREIASCYFLPASAVVLAIVLAVRGGGAL